MAFRALESILPLEALAVLLPHLRHGLEGSDDLQGSEALRGRRRGRRGRGRGYLLRVGAVVPHVAAAVDGQHLLLLQAGPGAAGELELANTDLEEK